MSLVTGIDDSSTSSPLKVPKSPPGVRDSQRRWRDPRLIVGVVLVVLSGLATTLVVSAADQRVRLWAVQDDVPAGSALTNGDLQVVEAHVPQLDPYWPADEPIPTEAIADHDFVAGELVTRDGVRPPEAVEVREVTLPVLRNQMPADLTVGDRVDVYVVEREQSGQPVGAPQLVLGSAIIAGVDDESGAFGSSSLEVGVALSVPDAQVPKVLDAQARGALTLVDVPVTTP